MRCPKCGTVQPEAGNCVKCHAEIGKYLPKAEPKLSETAPPEKKPKPASYHPASRGEQVSGYTAEKAFLILLIVSVVAIAVYFLWVNGNGRKGTFNKTTRIYINKKYGMELKIPASWKECAVTDVRNCRTIQKGYLWDYYLLVSAQADPKKSFLAVEIPADATRIFQTGGLPKLVSAITKSHQVLLRKAETVNGLNVYHMEHTWDYQGDVCFREDFLIPQKGLPLDVYFYLKNPSPGMIEKYEDMIEKNLSAV